jgi:hypothetical protein
MKGNDNMSDKYVHLMHLSPKELTNYLTSKGYPALKSREIYNTVTSQQERNKHNRRKGAATAREWERILPALRRERKVVRAMMQYTNYADREAQAKRTEAVEAYFAVLTKLATELSAYKRDMMSPAQVIEMLAKREDKPRKIPNEGARWVDWVPSKVRNRIEDLFDAIPQRFRAKVKRPFVVVDDNFDTKKLEMLVTIRKEWVAQQRIYEAMHDKTEDYAVRVREHIDKLERALDMTVDLDEKNGDYVPRTWHGFFNRNAPSRATKQDSGNDPFSVFYKN